MDKLILKNIAKEWCKGILLGCDSDAISDSVDRGVLTCEEAMYVVSEAHKIAERITKEPYLPNLDSIVDKYYEME